MKRLIRLTIVGLTVALTACSAKAPAPDRLQAEQRWNQVRGRVKYQLAEQQYQAGSFEDVLETAGESLALDPTQGDAHVLLARAYLELGKPASAQQVLEAARRGGLESAALLYTEGVILEQRNRLEVAIDKYAQARALDPMNADYLMAQVECLVAMGRPAVAFALLDEETDQIDENGTLAVLGAHVAAMLGDTHQAAQRYRTAVVPAGSSDWVAEELGVLLARSGRHHEALAVLQPLADAEDEAALSGAIRRALATCHLAFGDPASAKSVLGEYAAAHPEDTPAQLLLAKAAVAVDDWLTALGAVDLAEQREPTHPEVKFVRAVIQWKRGRFSAAAASLHDVLVQTPDDLEAHCLMAEVLLAQDHKEAARKHFERALQINPHCPWATAGLRTCVRNLPGLPTGGDGTEAMPFGCDG